tara:strand:+ start:2023 stop:2268 length:246 start_codon:yes stop_codon:yes gene_type:complete
MSKKNEAEQSWIWEQLDFFDQVEPIGLTDEIARLEETRIREALKEYNNNKTHAARNLGIGRTLLIHKIKKYEIDKDFIVAQ